MSDMASTPVAETPAAARPDGRTARAVRTREAVVEALLSLIEEGNLRPTAHEIADRAGVSLRSVFQHFSDLDTLFSLAAKRHIERYYLTLEPIPTDLPLGERVDALVAQQCGLFEDVTPVRRAASIMEPFSEEILSQVRRGQQTARGIVSRLFEQELARMDDADRRAALDALAAAASWNFWDTLRRLQGLSVPRAGEALRRLYLSMLRG